VVGHVLHHGTHACAIQACASLRISQFKRLDTHMDDTHMEAAGGVLGAAGG